MPEREPHTEEEHAAAALDFAAAAADVLSDVDAALDAGELTLAAVHAAELERLASLIHRHAEAAGRLATRL